MPVITSLLFWNCFSINDSQSSGQFVFNRKRAIILLHQMNMSMNANHKLCFLLLGYLIKIN